ncbi:MAG: anti-sigma factor domain-containing protein, partial [Burkholderiales bacterium]
QQVAGWIVEAEAGGKVRLVPLAATPVPPQKALEFWTKPQRAAAPTSLGLVPGDRVTEIAAARLPALEPEQLFELTLEPETGSPTGRPTGPVLFVGRAVAMR